MRRLLRVLPAAAAVLAVAPALAWTARTLTRPEHYPNLLVLALGAALALRRRAPLGALRPLVAPLALTSAALAAFWLVERNLDVSLLSAALAFVALYGAFGLYVSPGRWRRARGGALLALAALPLAEQAHHYAGFALRVATARVVASQLGDLGLAPVAAESILVLERGVADVEAACSGLGSVWAGSLILLGVAFERRRPVGLGFLVALGLQSGLLFAGNVLRITALVTLAHHYAAPGLAELVHQPLGVLAFAIATGAGALVLLKAPRPRRRPRYARRLHPALARLAPPALVTLSLLVGLTHARRAPEAGPALPFEPTLAAPVEANRIELDATERALFARWGAPSATKLALQLQRTAETPLTGAAVLVPARSWRAHHPPALCLAGSGHHLDGPRPARIGAVQAVFTTTDGGANTAVYWFQSAERTTGALLDRIEDGVFEGPRPWVLVTLVVRGAKSSDDPDLATLVDHLHQAVQRALPDPRSPS